MRGPLALAATVAAAGVAFPAAATSSVQDAEEFFLGVWAAKSCATAPAPENGLAVFFRLPDSPGLYMQTIERRPTGLNPTLTRVWVDRANPDGTAIVRYDHGGGVIYTTVMDISDSSTFSVVSSVDRTGTYSTRNHIFLKTNTPIAPYQRCSAKFSR